MTLSRRDLLRLSALGAAAGMTAGFGGWSPLSASRRSSDPGSGAGVEPSRQSALNLVTVPSSGQRLPQIGIGCRNYRGGPQTAQMDMFRATIETFHRLGGRVLDTSPNYGNSEQIVGDIMRRLGIRDDLFVATKVDREGRQEGIARMEGSFQRLGGEDFDLMQVHNLRGVEVQLETLRAWKADGRFRHIGVTTSNDAQYDALEGVMRRHALDFIQVDYSIGNRGAAERLIPRAADTGVAVLVNLPFGRGRLFSAVGDRSLPGWAVEIDATSWAQVFLKYVMSAPGVVIPIPGTTQPHHAEDNVGAAHGRLPGPELRREMEQYIDPLL